MRREAVYCERCGAYIPETTGECVACKHNTKQSSNTKIAFVTFESDLYDPDFTPINGYRLYYAMDTRLYYWYCDDGIFREL